MNWSYFPMMNVPYYVPYPFLPTPVQAIQQCFAFPSSQHLPGFGIQQNKEAGIINESNAITVLKQQKSKYQGLDIQITAQDLKQVSYQRTKKPWTEEQDKKLKRLCNCKYKDWTKIASLIPERSEKMCYSRYRRLKMTSRDPWTKKENQKILNLIKKHGENWDVISQHFQNRNSRTIKEHYESHLCPNVNKDDWTLQEDIKLIDLLKQYGKHWQFIKQFMDGRTQLQIKNRFYGRINKIAQTKRLKQN